MISRYHNGIDAIPAGSPVLDFTTALARIGVNELELDTTERALARAGFDTLAYLAQQEGWDEWQFLDALADSFAGSGIPVTRPNPVTTTANNNGNLVTVALIAAVALLLMKK